MTRFGRLLTLFPMAHALLVLGGLIGFVWRPGILTGLLVPGCIYLFPLIAFRLHELVFPLEEGITDLGKREYSPWWGGHQIQRLFLTIPQFESLLTLIPGLYSAWLRAWGSRIGANVYWTPQVEILDRSQMEISADVIFGHKIFTTCHVVTRTRSRKLLLMVKRISIGEGAFIGAGSRIGPGVEIEAGAVIAAATDLQLKTTVLQA